MKKTMLQTTIVVLMIAGLTSCSREHQFVNAKQSNQNNLHQATTANKNRVASGTDNTGVTVCNKTNDVCFSNESFNNETVIQPKIVTGTLQNKITENPQAEKVFVSTKIVSLLSVTVAKENQMPASEMKKAKVAKFVLKHADGADQLLCAIISIFIPPLGVALYEGGITTNFWIDLILTLLFFIPGLVYALIVILA